MMVRAGPSSFRNPRFDSPGREFDRSRKESASTRKESVSTGKEPFQPATTSRREGPAKTIAPENSELDAVSLPKTRTKTCSIFAKDLDVSHIWCLCQRIRFR